MIRDIIDIFQDSLNSFEGQKEGEKVLALLRHHPFNTLTRLGFYFLAGVLPLIATVALWPWLSEQNLASVALFALSAWWLALWLGVFHTLTIYTLDTVIITNKRLIDHDQLGLFDRKVSELDNNRIQDVTARTNGLIETLLNFGDVTVQTAGSDAHFIFHKVSRPEQIKDLIMELADVSTPRPTGFKMPSI